MLRYCRQTMTLTLTRLLYAKDEVIYSLINELLTQENHEACIFWATELFYSHTENIFSLIWKIYFDFYSEYNPGLDIYIQKKQTAWKTKKDIRHILYIVHNMFYLNRSTTTFLLRMWVESENTTLVIYRKSKRAEWLADYPVYSHSLLIALSKKHIKHASILLKELSNLYSSKTIYDIIVKYYNPSLNSADKIEKKWNKRGWTCDFHGLLALIVHLNTPVENITRPLVFKTPSSSHLRKVEESNQHIIDRHLRCDRVYRILKENREFTIHHLVGAFQLERNAHVNFINEIYDYWEYYASGSPVWKMRIKEFGGVFRGKHLEFDESPDKDFYDHYGLEPDEQSLHTQRVSNPPLRKYSIEEWHQLIFKKPCKYISGEALSAY